MSTHAPKVLMWKNVQKSCHFKHPLTDCFCVGRPIYKQGFSCFSKRGYVSSNGYSNSKPVSKMSSSSSQRIIVPPDIRNEAYTKRCLRSRHLNYHLSIGYQQIHSFSGKTRGISRQSEIKWWTESTEKLLDSSTISIGSWDSLIWHKAETMIAYWSEKGSSGLETSWRVLDRMMEEARGNHDHSFKMDIYLLHAVLLNWKKNFVKSGKRDLLPSKVLTKIDRYCAEAPFCLEPNVATYTIILDGAASCPDPAERVIFTDVLLHRLIEESGRNPALRPTAVTFGMVMKAWSKSGNLDLAKKSEGLLRQALELKNNQPGWEDLEINSLTYTSVLWAYANAGAPKPAQQLLLEMYQEYLVNDNLAVKPNVQAFNTVLTAWSRSSAPDAFANAEDLLFKMNELYRSGALDSPPNSASYNCVLNALARNPDIVENPVDKAEKLLKDQICMLKTDQQSRDQNKALLMTFTAMLRILATSNHADKDRQVELWLKKAKELGVEDDRFLLDQYETFLLKKKGETSTKKDGKIKNPL